jgi:hypothetical protein
LTVLKKNSTRGRHASAASAFLADLGDERTVPTVSMLSEGGGIFKFFDDLGCPTLDVI